MRLAHRTRPRRSPARRTLLESGLFARKGGGYLLIAPMLSPLPMRCCQASLHLSRDRVRNLSEKSSL